MSEFTKRRLLLLGFAASLIVVGVSVIVSALTGWFHWRAGAIAGLVLVIFVIAMQAVRPGSQLPGFAGGHEVYVEMVGRMATQDGISKYRPSTVQVSPLWALLPPFATLLVVGFVF